MPEPQRQQWSWGGAALPTGTGGVRTVNRHPDFSPFLLPIACQCLQLAGLGQKLEDEGAGWFWLTTASQGTTSQGTAWAQGGGPRPHDKHGSASQL